MLSEIQTIDTMFDFQDAILIHAVTLDGPARFEVAVTFKDKSILILSRKAGTPEYQMNNSFGPAQSSAHEYFSGTKPLPWFTDL